jgi:hypothetical protein
MVGIIDLLENFKASCYYQRRLKKVQEKALRHPENLFIQVRLGDLLTKLKKKKEAIGVYERAAEQFIQKNLFAHAIALKKIIFRLEPPKDDGEQMNLLDKLYEQMLIYSGKASIAEEPADLQTASPPSRSSEKGRGELQLEPKAILLSAS